MNDNGLKLIRLYTRYSKMIGKTDCLNVSPHECKNVAFNKFVIGLLISDVAGDIDISVEMNQWLKISRYFILINLGLLDKINDYLFHIIGTNVLTLKMEDFEKDSIYYTMDGIVKNHYTWLSSFLSSVTIWNIPINIVHMKQNLFKD